MFGSLKRKEITEPKEDIGLEVHVKVELKTNERYGEQVVAKVDLTELLKSTTDSRDKVILTELGNVLEMVAQKVEEAVHTNNRLTDGFHEAKRKEDATF